MRSTSLITIDRHVGQGVADVSSQGIGAGLDPAAAAVRLPAVASTRFGDVVLARVA